MYVWKKDEESKPERPTRSGKGQTGALQFWFLYFHWICGGCAILHSTWRIFHNKTYIYTTAIKVISLNLLAASMVLPLPFCQPLYIMYKYTFILSPTLSVVIASQISFLKSYRVTLVYRYCIIAIHVPIKLIIYN